MIFDTHSHCYWDNLDCKIDQVVEGMKSHTVQKSTQIGCDMATSQKAISLARRFPWVFYATVWYHPESAQNTSYSLEILQSFERLIIENRNVVVAVGECGFDFHYLDGSEKGNKKVDINCLSKKATQQIQNQEEWFLAQWELAKKHDLPLVIHTRDARDATLECMQKNSIHRAVMHSYAQDPDFARTLLDFSWEIYFSFSGILTYKSAPLVQETAKILPLNRILIETDAPFLAPQPVRGNICEPQFARYTLQKLIELRQESADEIQEQVYKNSLRFYGIDS